MTTYTTAQVNAWYESVQFRTGPTATVSSYVDLLNAGSLTATQVQNAIIGDTYTFANANTVIRLYQAAFNRVSDQAGQNYWVDIMGATPDAQKTAQLQSIATQFANSTEFVAQYGVNASAPINAAVLTAFYANVLNRTPDTAGFNYWLNSGQNTAQVLNAFAQSAEFTVSSNNAITLFQQAEIAGTAATSGSLFQYGGFPTESVVMTTAIETINASDYVRDITISGVQQDTGSTWNTGDIINGNGRTNVNLTANGNPGTVAANASVVDVNDVNNLNVNLVVDTALNAALFTNVGNVLVNQGITGSELTVSTAQLSTSYGASIAGRAVAVLVDYSTTATGTSDTARLNLGGSFAGGGTGTSTNRSAFNVSTGNVIDAITVSTNGAVFAEIAGGTGAKTITATGAGTNDITVGSLASGATVDFSGTTGSNKLGLGTFLSTINTVKGGSGADTVSGEVNTATQIIPTMTGVETLTAKFSAAGILNASKITGLTTLNVEGNTAAGTFSNLNKSVATINTAASNTGLLTVGYAAGSAAVVDYNIGGDAAVANGATTFSNAANLTIDAVGKSTSGTGNLNVGTATALTLTTAAAANDLTVGNLTAGSLQTLTVNATGGNVTLSTDLDVGSSNLTSISVTADNEVALDILGGQAFTAAGKLQTIDATIGNKSTLNLGGVTAAKSLQSIALTAGDDATLTAAIAFVVHDTDSAFTALSVKAGSNATLALTGTSADGIFIDGVNANTAINSVSFDVGGLAAASSVGDIEAESISAVTLSVGTSSVARTLTIDALKADVVGNITATVGQNSTIDITDIVELGDATTGSIGNVVASGAGSFNFRVDESGSDYAAVGFVDFAALAGGGIAVFNNAITTGTNMTGGNGADTLTGTGGADVISGGAGGDTITGLRGADTLTGGLGADRFVFTTAVTTDTVTDFSGASGQLDLGQVNYVAVNLAGGMINGQATVIGDGTSVAIAGAGAVGAFLTVATDTATTALTTSNLLNITGTTFASTAAVETFLAGADGITTNAVTGMTQWDSILLQWQGTDGNYYLGSVVFDLTVAKANDIAATDISVYSIATMGTTALVAADLAFV